MLPAPALTFTIPSTLDDAVIDARIYLPPVYITSKTSREWRKKAAIVAHPYAPLGGSYDDPVVSIIGAAILKQGFVLGTFNFRGASNSKAHTSWTSKGETADYTSFVGFMAYFVHHLLVPYELCTNLQAGSDNIESYNLSPVPSHALPPPHQTRHHAYSPTSISPSVIPQVEILGGLSNLQDSGSLLLLGGYSYGAMITSHLPSLATILTLFSSPIIGTAASEIRLRAQQLAKQQNEIFVVLAKACAEKSVELKHSRGRSLQSRDGLNPRKSSTSIRIGGEETDVETRRVSHESHGRRSFTIDAPERLWKSMDRVRSMGKRHNSGGNGREHPLRQTSFDLKISKAGSQKSGVSLPTSTRDGDTPWVEEKAAMPLVFISDIKAAYLLISPLQGAVTGFATLWSIPNSKAKSGSSKEALTYEAERKFWTNDALAVFGDEDMFSSIKKLRSWAERLAAMNGSRFQHLEITGAGHFWHEDGVAAKMRDAVTTYAGQL